MKKLILIPILLFSLVFSSGLFQIKMPKFKIQPSLSSIVFNSFSANKYNFSEGETIILSWDINKAQKIFLYNDPELTNLVADVTDLSEYSVTPTDDMSYYLDYQIGVSSLNLKRVYLATELNYSTTFNITSNPLN